MSRRTKPDVVASPDEIERALSKLEASLEHLHAWLVDANRAQRAEDAKMGARDA